MRCGNGELQREIAHAASRLAAGGSRSRGRERFLHVCVPLVPGCKTVTNAAVITVRKALAPGACDGAGVPVAARRRRQSGQEKFTASGCARSWLTGHPTQAL
jgi:hypothetical protein